MGLQYQNFSNGISLESKTTSTNASKGDLEVLNASGKLNYNNGTTSSPVVTEAHSSTLTNKTINGPDNTITNLTNSNLNGSAGITNANLANSSLTVNGNIVSLGGSTTITANTNNALTIGTGLQLNSGTTFDGSSAKTLSIDSSVVTLSDSQVLTNKTISLTNNTLTGTSAQLATAISDETGSGLLVFNNTPTLITPQLNALNVNGTYTLTLPVTSPANNTTLVHTTSGTYVWGESNPSPKITIYDTASSGTHTTASNVKYIKVRMVAGGGNGGSGGFTGGTVETGGGGGGGGGYVEAYITSPSASYSYTVGSAGSGSTFGGFLTAQGGSVGSGGSLGGDGGAGGGGSITATPGVTGFVSFGQGGGGGDRDDLSSTTSGGVGGSSVLGGGGRSIVSSAASGAAFGFGGGGAGGRGPTGTGGAGKNGIIIIEEYYNY